MQVVGSGAKPKKLFMKPLASTASNTSGTNQMHLNSTRVTQTTNQGFPRASTITSVNTSNNKRSVPSLLPQDSSSSQVSNLFNSHNNLKLSQQILPQKQRLTFDSGIRQRQLFSQDRVRQSFESQNSETRPAKHSVNQHITQASVSAQASNSAAGDQQCLMATAPIKYPQKLTNTNQMSNLDTAPRSPNSNQAKREGMITRCETSSPSAKDAVENSETNSLPTFTNLTFQRKPFELKQTSQFQGSNDIYTSRMKQLQSEHLSRQGEYQQTADAQANEAYGRASHRHLNEIERIRGSSPVEEAIPFKKAPTEKMSRKQEIQLANATQTASIRSTSRQPFTSQNLNVAPLQDQEQPKRFSYGDQKYDRFHSKENTISPNKSNLAGKNAISPAKQRKTEQKARQIIEKNSEGLQKFGQSMGKAKSIGVVRS